MASEDGPKFALCQVTYGILLRSGSADVSDWLPAHTHGTETCEFVLENSWMSWPSLSCSSPAACASLFSQQLLVKTTSAWQEAAMDMKTFMCDRQTANRVVRNAEATQESRQQVSSKNASGRKRRRKARSAVQRARLTPKRLFYADAETQVASAGEESGAHEEEEEDQDMADDASEEGHAEQKQDDEEDEEKRSCGSPSEDKDLFGDRFAFHTPKGAGTKPGQPLGVY